MTLVLSLDTSSPAISVALVKVASGDRPQRGRPACWQVVDGAKHGELLSTGITAVLAQLSVTAADLQAVVVGLGPGPFTGLRVGIVTAASMADARNIPAYGVCSLDAVGTGARVVVTDARRKEVYWAQYGAGGERVAGPSVSRPADLQNALVEQCWQGPVLGAGAMAYDLATAAEPLHPSAEQLALLAADRVAAGAPSENLLPYYLRRPDATPTTERKRAAP